MITCCYNCPERSVGCHSHCSKYLLAKKEHDQRKAELYAIESAEQGVVEIVLRGIQKAQKRRRDTRY